MYVVVLARIEPGVLPAYCTHGRATCVDCDEWVWLGDNTYDVVASGQALPLCEQCAERALGLGGGSIELHGHVRDHRRSDGPHA